MSRFYFAWADETETLFTDDHAREDEQVFSFDLRQSEGEFAGLTITLRNPRVQLLDPLRNRWAWLSADDGSAIHPLFYGRLIGLPADLHRELIVLEFVARPRDYVARQSALAATLRVAPFYDPIWFNDETRQQPDNVLEARAALWHVDPVTHELTISSILAGEDGTVAVGPDDVLYDSLRMTFGQAPARRCQVTAKVSWDQKVLGSIDVAPAIRDLFSLRNSGTSSYIQSYTGAGLLADWPKVGASFGGGWSVKTSALSRLDGSRGPTEQIDEFPAGFGDPDDVSLGRSFKARYAPWFGSGGFSAKILFPAWSFGVDFQLQYEASRRRNEELAFILEADVQSVLSDESADQLIELAISSSELANPVDADGEPPIREQRARAYFTTDRGAESVRYLIALARAKLLSRSRMVRLSFAVPFWFGVHQQMSCRKSILLTDARLPGGSVLGKITEYRYSVDGGTGELRCHLTIECCVGRGNAQHLSPGLPLYVDLGYVEPGYQRYDGQTVFVVDDEVFYQDISGQEPDDDGLTFPLTPAKAALAITLQNAAPDQEARLSAGAETIEELFTLLNAAKTRVGFRIKPVTTGPFLTAYQLVVSRLTVPNQIDLGDFSIVLEPATVVNVSVIGALSWTYGLRPATVVNVNVFGTLRLATAVLQPATVVNTNTFGAPILAVIEFSSTLVTWDRTAPTWDMD